MLRPKSEADSVIDASYSVAGPPTNFSFVDDYVGGSGRPLLESEVEWTKKRGISAILSLTENPLSSEWVKGLEYKNVPMTDHSIPTVLQLTEAVGFVLLQLQNNRKVLVHCLAGKGRTGTVLAAYLCLKNNLSLNESLRVLRTKRPGSVEANQVPVLIEFCETVSLQ